MDDQGFDKKWISLKRFLTEYKETLLDAYYRDIDQYNKTKETMYLMTIHHPNVISKILNNVDQGTEIGSGIGMEIDSENISKEMFEKTRRLFSIIRSHDLRQIKGIMDQICSSVDQICMRLDTGSVRTMRTCDRNLYHQDDKNIKGALMTMRRPKLKHWLEYARAYEMDKMSRKIIKHLNQEYENSSMNDHEFIDKHRDAIKLLHRLNPGLNKGMNIHLATTIQMGCMKKEESLKGEIIDEKTAIDFMCKYNEMIWTNTKQHTGVRMFPKTFPCDKYDESNGSVLFKNITYLEYLKMRMLDNMISMDQIKTGDQMDKLLTTQIMCENMLPRHLDKNTISEYQKICNGKSVLINELQTIIDHDDIFDLAQDFNSNLPGNLWPKQWIIEEIVLLNFMIQS
jgi:hypothetical protein